MLVIPEYFEYIVWDYSDKWNPKIKGFRKDTPPELIEKWKKDCKEINQAIEKGDDL